MQKDDSEGNIMRSHVTETIFVEAAARSHGPANPDCVGAVREEMNMAKIIIGNASAITVPRRDRESIRRFYCDVLGGKIVKEDGDKDIFRLEEEFYILFRYGDVADESEFLRSPRALWLQIKSDNVEEMTRKILDFGAKKIDLPSGLPESVPYLYFQAPGGQCFQLLPITENQSYYKRRGNGSNVAEEKEAEALKEKAMGELAMRHHKKR
jgi:catechol 2,3-dioxygenase-like lactoylglutathione lyase family enzyme